MAEYVFLSCSCVIIVIVVAVGIYFKFFKKKVSDGDSDLDNTSDITAYLTEKEASAAASKANIKSLTVNRMHPSADNKLCVEALQMQGGTASIKKCNPDPRYQHQQYQWNANSNSISSADGRWCLFSAAAQIKPKSDDPNVKDLSADNTNGGKVIVKPCSNEYGGKWINDNGVIKQDNGVGRMKCLLVEKVEDSKDVGTWYCDENAGTPWSFSPYTGTYEVQ